MMDEQQQVFWTDINLCHKNKWPKKKQSTQTELFAYVKTAKHRFYQFPYNMANGKGDELPIFPVRQEAAAGSQESGGT